MEPLDRTVARLGKVTLVAAMLVALPAAVGANEITTRVLPTSTGIVIHDADETLRSYCRTDADGVLWLELPGGTRYELITSINDPAISNHGDGAFHPFDAAEVAAAFAAVSYPLDDVVADVFILPYPRRAGLASAAGANFVLLSPGVYALPRTQQHTEAVHELGHVVQRQDLPDSDTPAWDRYRGLRGINDTAVYNEAADHADRPHEIFAEDFGALFGGALATSTGTIENSSLTPPTEVAGLEGFILSLADAQLAVSLGATPNPSRGAVVFTRGGAPAVALDLFDLAGRRLASLAPVAAGNGQRWTWNGRDDSGRRVEPGVVFARTHDGAASARVILLP